MEFEPLKVKMAIVLRRDSWIFLGIVLKFRESPSCRSNLFVKTYFAVSTRLMRKVVDSLHYSRNYFNSRVTPIKLIKKTVFRSFNNKTN